MLPLQMKPTRQTLQFDKGLLSTYRRLLVPMVLILSLLCLPTCGACEMAAMTDDELAAITGHGFSDFSLTLASEPGEYDIARIDLNLKASTYATMDSMKMGYWNNGGTGWDQNWLGVSIGSDATDMVLSGFVLQAEFTDIDNAAIRELKSITMGFQSATGTLSANFASLSELDGTSGRINDGDATYTFNGGPLMMHINVDGDNPGIWFDFGSATRN
jgi:hypothetical protein